MPIAIKDSKIDITSEKLTKELAKEFTKYLKGGEFVFLYGEMGVGKTTFVKYLINEYQNINDLTQTEIPSPTFSLLNEYQLKNIRIKHYDLFRINRKEDINNLDIFEQDNKLITLIEWPQLIADKQDIKFIALTFNYLNDLNDRSVDIKI
ncbi:tRNA (adenosine(37)-N6)-threonylcarbamoyltransferase complex ATPase subunit type 1 TsaE [Candidatus Pelagibacter sp.]|nr:tRNA (adenosine(37)-N6)-threonylcarbamoyltransferase complex ATPase subunit type 1 TsaE [Candidatus Pelagibacter sp.]